MPYYQQGKCVKQRNTQTICKIICFVRNNSYLCTRNQVMIATISRSGAVVARWAHNPKVIGSSPVSATTERESTRLVLFFLCFMPSASIIRHIKLAINILQTKHGFISGSYGRHTCFHRPSCSILFLSPFLLFSISKIISFADTGNQLTTYHKS